MAEHLCDISANEIELVRDSDCEEGFATGVSGLDIHYSYCNLLDIML